MPKKGFYVVVRAVELPEDAEVARQLAEFDRILGIATSTKPAPTMKHGVPMFRAFDWEPIYWTPGRSNADTIVEALVHARSGVSSQRQREFGVQASPGGVQWVLWDKKVEEHRAFTGTLGPGVSPWDVEFGALATEAADWHRRLVSATSAGDADSTMGNDHPDPLPRMKRPVIIAEAARVAGMRSDALTRRLRTRMYAIGGIKGAYSADADHILICVPEKRKQVTEWLEKIFPTE